MLITKLKGTPYWEATVRGQSFLGYTEGEAIYRAFAFLNHGHE